MKQFLAVAALNEAVEKHCDTRRDVKIYTEGCLLYTSRCV